MVERAMDSLRLPPGDAQTAVLSGGEKRRVSLCRLLLASHDMLLLDEPTNREYTTRTVIQVVYLMRRRFNISFTMNRFGC